MLTFGKDSFRVSIVAKREKHAEYFAAFVERAIEEFLKRSEEQKKVSKTPVYGIIENPLKNDPFWNNKNKFFEYELKSEYYLRHRY